MTKILIIEDTAPLRMAIAEVLEHTDVTLIIAEDGISGVAQAQREIPDLILCDEEMPCLDGYGVLAELQKSPLTARIPFVLMTTHADSGPRPHETRSLVRRLYKPFKVTDLMGIVETLLGTKRGSSFQQEHVG